MSLHAEPDLLSPKPDRSRARTLEEVVSSTLSVPTETITDDLSYHDIAE